MIRKKTDYIIIHCSDTPSDMDVGVAEIDQWHKQRGFSKVGYHFVIRRNGKIEEGRELNEVGAHCKDKGRNHDSIGICLVGRDEFEPEQFGSLDFLLRYLTDKNFHRAAFPNVTVKGHRDFHKGKTCPNFDVTEWLNERPNLTYLT